MLLCHNSGGCRSGSASHTGANTRYSMLRRCRDPEKCTFIVTDKSLPGDSVAAMVGDVNLYLNDPDDRHRAEIEV